MLTSSLAGPTGGFDFIRRPTSARSIDDVSCRVCVEGQAITSVWRLDLHVVGVCPIALLAGAGPLDEVVADVRRVTPLGAPCGLVVSDASSITVRSRCGCEQDG